tara:strand:+ start:5294 stop:6091 length:798 start_codon:yes stop_codon:yes gene_type:complete
MDCVSVVATVPGLRFRRPTGLTRPQRDVAGIGKLELVLDGESHSWEVLRQLVPTRMTRISGMLEHHESELSDERFVQELLVLELGVRRRIANAWCEHFAAPSDRPLSKELVLDNLADWMIPYHIQRLPDGFDFNYDCTDAPNGSLLGACSISAKVTPDLSVVEFAVGNMEEIVHYQSELFRQRIIPPDCGFVEDSIADQLIVSPCWHLDDNQQELLFDSIRQTRELVDCCTEQNRQFLNAALSNLERLYWHHRKSSLRPEQYGEP